METLLLAVLLQVAVKPSPSPTPETLRSIYAPVASSTTEMPFPRQWVTNPSMAITGGTNRPIVTFAADNQAEPDARSMVWIRPNGTVTFAPDYKPDEAARSFWLALSRYNPLRPRVEELEGQLAELREKLTTCPPAEVKR